MHHENLTKTLLIRASANLLTRVKAAADAAHQPISWWVRDALEERLARVESVARTRRKASVKRSQR